jgi:hypothetical protein
MRRAGSEEAGGGRMNHRHRLFNIAAAISLALCVAMIALCFRSCDRYDDFRLTRHVSIWQSDGQLGLTKWTRVVMVAHETGPAEEDLNHRILQAPRNEHLGVSITRHGAIPVESAVSVSYVSLILISLALPFIWLVRPHPRRVTNPSVCSACGYNLTGNTSGVCPECGTAVP